MLYFFAADYLRQPKFSLTNWYILKEFAIFTFDLPRWKMLRPEHPCTPEHMFGPKNIVADLWIGDTSILDQTRMAEC